jgi:hypothetical protein
MNSIPLEFSAARIFFYRFASAFFSEDINVSFGSLPSPRTSAGKPGASRP